MRESAEVTNHDLPDAPHPHESMPLTSSLLSEVFAPLGNADEFIPRAPRQLSEMRLPESLIESLILKTLLNLGSIQGRDVAAHVRLPFGLLEPVFSRMKLQQLISHRGSDVVHDYKYELTPEGHRSAQRFREVSTYFGATPVQLDDYIESVEAQSLKKQSPSAEKIRAAFADMTLHPRVFRQVGQAVRAARALFLYGSPGNGKTSVAQRICKAYGESIWIPRTLYIDGEIVRLFDPTVHEALDNGAAAYLDERWVRIRRPTIMAGGELTMQNLELTLIAGSGVCEAPLQLKSSCGVLVIDDFGRQQMSPDTLLNRWIVPLETGYDFLNLMNGKKVRVPFDQMLVFSTNLEPRQLVDEAFLRRIPYKVEAVDPSEEEFKSLLKHLAAKFDVAIDEESIHYLLDHHYREQHRPFRYCHPRDLLQQVQIAADFNGESAIFTPKLIDMAAENYFVDLLAE